MCTAETFCTANLYVSKASQAQIIVGDKTPETYLWKDNYSFFPLAFSPFWFSHKYIKRRNMPMYQTDIVHQICCGIDVHRDFVVACILTTEKNLHYTKQTRHFSTFTKDLRLLAEWLKKNNCIHVCMESTGKYWTPLWNILEVDLKPVVVHPKYVKALKGQKTDIKDAEWIAKLFRLGHIKASFIPPPDIRALRSIMRYRAKLSNAIVAEKNRAQNCLTVSNIKLDSVFTDSFGKSSLAIIGELLGSPNTFFDVAPFVDKRCKSSIEKIQAAIDGTMDEYEAKKLKVILDHLDCLEEKRELLLSEALEIAKPFLPQIELIMTVPGIQSISALIIISEIGLDMSVFPTSRNLCSWAGLVPQNDNSAGKKKTTRISRAGEHLKPTLIQFTLAAIRCKDFPEISRRYNTIKRRRGHHKAIIAVARTLLTAIYQMLKKNEPYNPELYCQSNLPPKNRVVTEEEAIYILQRKGYVVTRPA